VTTIRPGGPADAEELARLRWAFRVEHGTPASTSFEVFAAAFRGFAEDVLGGDAWRVWVAEADGRLVGCVWLQLVERVPHPNLARWERPIAYVTSMFVEPGLRDAGLGRGLLDVAVAFARLRRVDGVILWPSERSVPFYERAGFSTEKAPLMLEIEGD